VLSFDEIKGLTKHKIMFDWVQLAFVSKKAVAADTAYDMT